MSDIVLALPSVLLAEVNGISHLKAKNVDLWSGTQHLQCVDHCGQCTLSYRYGNAL